MCVLARRRPRMGGIYHMCYQRIQTCILEIPNPAVARFVARRVGAAPLGRRSVPPITYEQVPRALGAHNGAHV